MKKNLIGKRILCLFCSFLICRESLAQLSLDGQLRTRTEFRNGQGAPLPEGAAPAFFTSQRTRLGLRYNSDRLQFGLSLQDVRVWGQDVSGINATTTQNNNGLLLHEAWAEILLTDTSLRQRSLSLKIGRQELVYDDARLLGNLDWLQQGRRHDAVLLKFSTPLYAIHLAAAYNQNQQNVSGTVYNSTPPGNYPANTNGGAMYKSMEFLHLGRKLERGNASALFFTDQFSKYRIDTTDAGPLKVFKPGTWVRMTTGAYLNDTLGRLGLTAEAYYQFGKNADGHQLSAGLLSGLLQYACSRKFSAGAGLDYTSGGGNGNVSHAFDPLYGTPHKFWGYMDYFYAASAFGKGGLLDYYIKTKFTPSGKCWLTADVHQFASAAGISGTDKKNFGQELDIAGNYTLTRQIAFEAGYSHFFGTALLASVKNIAGPKPGADWAYLSVNIHPSFLFR